MTKVFWVRSIWLLPTLLIAGCITPGIWGSAFERQFEPGILLGSTSVDNLMNRMGEPNLSRDMPVWKVLSTKVGTFAEPLERLQSINNFELREMYYGHSGSGIPKYEDQHPTRGQIFYFFQNRLVGHYYLSTLRDDHTDFAVENIEKIVTGKTIRKEVHQLLGPPTGRFVYPLAPRNAYDADVYYSETAEGWITGGRFKARFNHQIKKLIVIYNNQNTVIDVLFAGLGL